MPPTDTFNPKPLSFADFQNQLAATSIEEMEQALKFTKAEADKKRLSDWERMLSDDFDGVARERGFLDRFEKAAALIPRDQVKAKVVRDLFVQDLTKANGEQLRSGVPQLNVAKGVLGLSDPSDAAFDSAMRAFVTDQADTRDRTDQAAKAAHQATIQGRPMDEVMEIAKAKAGDKWKAIEPIARAEHARIAAEYSPEELSAARDLFEMAAKSEGAAVENLSKDSGFRGVLYYGKSDQATRDRILGLVALQAESEGKKTEGYFRAMSANLEDFAAGIFGRNERGKAAALRKVASSMRLPEDAKVTDDPDSLYNRLFVTPGGRVMPNNEISPAAKTREMTSEEFDALQELADMAEGAGAFMTDIKSAGVRVRPFIDEETKGFWRRATLNAANSLPSMVLAAAPGGIGMVAVASSYGERNLAEVRLQGGTVTPATEAAANVAGFLEAGIDRLEWFTMGAKLPRVTASVLKWGKPGAALVYGARALGVAGMETGQEAAQDLTFPAVQDLTSAFTKDMPGPDWQGVLINEYDALGDIFGASLVFGVIGATGSTATQYFDRDRLRETLRDRAGLALAGYPAETVEQIATLADVNVGAAAETLKAAMIETPAEVRKANSEAARAKMEANPLPTAEEALIPEIEERSDGGYQVKYPDGRVDAAESEDDAIQAVRVWEEEDLNRMEMANRALARELEMSHADNPELTANVRFTGKEVNFETWAGDNAQRVEVARQRVRIAMRQEFLTGERDTDGSELRDEDLPLDAYLILGTSQNFGGAVTRIAMDIHKRGNVATVLEEHAEGVVKWLMDSGRYSRADVVRGIRETEAATGKKSLADDLDTLAPDASERAIVEAFSRLAVANAFGKISESSLSAKFKALFRAIKEAFSAILSLAGQIREIQLAGQMDEQFEYWLDVAGGVSDAYRMENLQKAAERELQEAAFEGFPEITSTLKGMLPHPDTEGAMFPGELRRIYEGLQQSAASKSAGTRKANEFFLPVGEAGDLDQARVAANAKGFAFDTPGEMLDALDLSVNYNRPQYGVSGGMESFSIARADSPLIKAIDELAKSPEATATVFKQMRVKVGQVRERMDKARRASGFSEEELDPERFERLRDIATLEAIAKALPQPIRGKLVGSFARLEDFKTMKGREAYLVKLLPKIEAALEQHLQTQYRAAIRREMQRGAVKVSEAKTRGGKIGATGHMIFDQAKSAMKLDAAAAELEATKLQDQIDGAESLTMAQLEELDSRLSAVELFRDYENASAARLEKGLELLKDTYREGRKEWLETLMDRRILREQRIFLLKRGLGLTSFDAEGVERDVFITDAMRNAAKERNRGARFSADEAIMAAGLSGSQKLRRLWEMSDDPTVKLAVEAMEDAFHFAETNEADMNLADNAALAQALRDIFKVSNVWSVSRRLNELSTPHSAAPVEKIEGRAKEQISVPISIVESIIAGEVSGFTDAKGVRIEIDAHDLEALTESWDRFQDLQEEEQAKRRVINFDRIRAKGERKTIGEVSQLEGLQLYLTMRQPDQAKKLDRLGYDEETLAQLEAWLKPEVKALGAWMVDFLGADAFTVDALHRAEKGVALPLVANYFPVRNDVSGSDSSGLSLDGSGQQQSGRSVSFIKERVANNAPPAYVNALAVFTAHRAQANFWKSHVTAIREWGGVIKDERFSAAVKYSMGNAYYQSLTQLLARIESGGALAAKQQLGVERLVRTITRNFALGTLGLRMSTLMVNTTAALNAGTEIPAADLIKGMLQVAKRPEAFADAWKSPAIQRRLKAGGTFEAQLAKTNGPIAGGVKASLQWAAEKGVAPINIVDTSANLLGAAVVWEHARSKAARAGLPEDQARTEADRAVERLFLRAAQPTSRLAKSELEMRALDHPMAALFLMFVSEPRKSLAIAYMAGREILTGKGTYGKAMAAQQLAVTFLAMGAATYIVRSLAAAWFKAKDDEEDEVFARFWRRMTDGKAWGHALATNHLQAVPLAGEIWNQLSAKFFDQKAFPASQNILNQGTGKTIKWIEKLGEEQTARDAVEGGIDLMQGIGTVVPGGALLAQLGNAAEFVEGAVHSAGVDLSPEDRRARYKARYSKFGKELEALHGKTTGEDGKIRKDVQAVKWKARADWLRANLAPLPEAEREKFLEEINAGAEIRKLMK